MPDGMTDGAERPPSRWEDWRRHHRLVPIGDLAPGDYRYDEDEAGFVTIIDRDGSESSIVGVLPAAWEFEAQGHKDGSVSLFWVRGSDDEPVPELPPGLRSILALNRRVAAWRPAASNATDPAVYFALGRLERLSAWDAAFVRSVAVQRGVSARQREQLDRICLQLRQGAPSGSRRRPSEPA